MGALTEVGRGGGNAWRLAKLGGRRTICSVAVSKTLIPPAEGRPDDDIMPFEGGAHLGDRSETVVVRNESVPGPERRPLGDAPWVALVALIVGGAAWWFSQSHGLLMLYGDARSHLSIARRLVDGPNQGIVQLGTVWPPLSHFLMAPLSLIRPLWETGGAGALVGTVCLAIEAVAVSTIVRACGGKRLAAWFAVLLLLGNPAWLYLHTTAMAESVTFASVLWSLAALSRWASDKRAWSGGQLAVYAGFPTAAAIFSRYDGWSFTAAAVCFVFLICIMRWRQWRYAVRMTACYAAAPVVAAGWWMWFNWQHFGDPLEFWRGKWSAQSQQAGLERLGELPDKGRVVPSVVRYSVATWDVSGPIIVVAALVGMILWAYKSRLRPAGLAPWLAVLIPVLFHVASLYRGEIAIRLSEMDGKSMWNIRYGAQAMAGLAIFGGLGLAVLLGDLRPVVKQRLASRRERIAVRKGERRRERRRFVLGVVAFGLVVVAAGSWWPAWQETPLIAEGLGQRAAGDVEWDGALWLKKHATEGTILIDDSTHPMLPVIATNYNRVLAPFSGPEYNKALRDPGRSRARWMYEQTSSNADQVATALRRKGATSDFTIAFQSGDVIVWERKGSG